VKYIKSAVIKSLMKKNSNTKFIILVKTDFTVFKSKETLEP